MLVGAVILFWWVLPLFTAPLAQAAVAVAAVLLALGAVYRIIRPPGGGPFVVRLSNRSEVTAGFWLDVTLLMRPRETITLDPLTVRLVARRGEGKHEEVAYETEHRLIERRDLPGGRAARIETRIRLPEDAPVTSATPLLRWRLEVTFGAPPRLQRVLVVRVRPPTRRRATRARRDAA